MKIFVENLNSIMTLIIERIKPQKDLELCDNPCEADLFLLWQDVRGQCLRIAESANLINKPVVVVQHGRGAMRDYDVPNKFLPIANAYCVWGEMEKRRLEKVYGREHTEIYVTGSPLVPYLKPKVPHPGKVVLYVPIIMEKEEPENLMVFGKLKEWESKVLVKSLVNRFEELKRAWATRQLNVWPEYVDACNKGLVRAEDVPHNEKINPNLPIEMVYNEGLVVTLHSGLHDVPLYACPHRTIPQGTVNGVETIIDALRTTDVVVCLEEGTLPLLATAMDIPVIHVDIYKTRTYGGVDYSKVEWIKTDATYRTKNLNDLPDLLDYCLLKDKDNQFKKQLRIKVCEEELGPQYGDTIGNILNVVKQFEGVHAK